MEEKAARLFSGIIYSSCSMVDISSLQSSRLRFIGDDDRYPLPLPPMRCRWIGDDDTLNIFLVVVDIDIVGDTVCKL